MASLRKAKASTHARDDTDAYLPGLDRAPYETVLTHEQTEVVEEFIVLWIIYSKDFNRFEGDSEVHPMGCLPQDWREIMRSIPGHAIPEIKHMAFLKVEEYWRFFRGPGDTMAVSAANLVQDLSRVCFRP